jgi:hypothetical protein
MRLRRAAVISLAICVSTASAAAGEMFVVTGTGIANSGQSSQYVNVGERLPIAALKKRFSGFTVQSTAGEDCVYCAFVSRSETGFEVNYDETGVVVTSIVCGQGCSDAVGNEVEGKLSDAIGEVGNCDAGYYTTCDSQRLKGLTYIVYEDPDNCSFEVTGASTPIPACATIGGFISGKLWEDVVE